MIKKFGKYREEFIKTGQEECYWPGWLYIQIEHDIKDLLIEWHKVEGGGLLRPDPEESEIVFVCWINHPEWAIAKMHIVDSADGWLWGCDDYPYEGELWDGDRPTHYMYLPKPPKE